MESGVNSPFNPGIYDEFTYNHWVDATAGEVFVPPEDIANQVAKHLCVDINYH